MSAKATEPDAVAKGLQSRTTLENGILNGRNKKPSPPPVWVTIRLGHARQTITNNNNGKIKYIIINYKSEEEKRMIPNNSPPEVWAGAIPQEKTTVRLVVEENTPK